MTSPPCARWKRVADCISGDCGRIDNCARESGYEKQGKVLAQKKIRVHELSKELGLTSKELLTLAQKLGIGASSPSASIEDAQADRIRRRADADGLRREVQPEEAAKAAKATKAVKATKASGATKAVAPAPEPAVVEAPPARVSRVTKAAEPTAATSDAPAQETPAPAA